MPHRIHNFCAGPCTLPLTVLEEAREELLDFQGSGMSVMEISHRSKRFEPLHEEALALAQELIGAPDDFMPLFLPGGAHQQFVMTAMNLLADGGSAAFANSGVWAEKALKEAQRIGKAQEIWSGRESGFTTLPAQFAAPPADSRYLHVTSNETIGGIQYRTFPESPLPLVIDASSDYYARTLPWERCAIVYGGAQKNLAPSGIAVVFVRRDLLKDHAGIPKFLTYKAHADANSLYNTPPTWQIYLLGKVLHWMKAQGGVARFEEKSIEKSSLLYDYLDQSAFYRNDIAPEYRSRTNVIFRTPTEALDTRFWQEAEKAGLSGLKGHRIVGGLRASLYNALELDSVRALIAFMEQFAREHG
ncbi:MAG: 3-phosphoserine/phosphohydroxythreonine transaminase [Cardiobacteriaceae bacterium]|nr:3-phosphoserine/phosphohydroxythreonine transaminase [Cardiobacteriaceae bacterium]